MEAYFEYVRTEDAVVPVDIVSFFSAQALKVKALAKTVTIMIAFRILILFLTPFVAGCCRALCFILANANCATTGDGLPSCEAEAILPASWSALLNGQDVRLPQQPRWLCHRCKVTEAKKGQADGCDLAFRSKPSAIGLRKSSLFVVRWGRRRGHLLMLSTSAQA